MALWRFKRGLKAGADQGQAEEGKKVIKRASQVATEVRMPAAEALEVPAQEPLTGLIAVCRSRYLMYIDRAVKPGLMGLLMVVAALTGGGVSGGDQGTSVAPEVRPRTVPGIQSGCRDSVPQPLEASWLPVRPGDAMTGTAFAAHTAGWKGLARQQEALAQLQSGNIPGFLSVLKPIRLSHTTRRGRVIRAVVWVMPDYLSIGSDADFLRIPLTRPSAVQIAAEWDFVLPTRKIVDAIKDQADFRFEPQPLKPGPKMRSSEYYLRHNQMIEEQRRGRPLGELLAGHKKDVVVSNRILGRERIAIYGWHRKNGKPIQDLSTVHAARYADYSHGIRMVYAMVCIDGEPRSIYDVLEDPDLAPVLSYEGWIARIRNLMRW